MASRELIGSPVAAASDGAWGGDSHVLHDDIAVAGKPAVAASAPTVRPEASALASIHESIDSPSSGSTCSGKRRRSALISRSYYDKIFETAAPTAA
jgi:hypothetical protein